MNDFEIEYTFRPNENGMVLVSCPECEMDFTIPFESDDKIICSHCKLELEEVYPPRSVMDQAIETFTQQALGYASERVGNRNIDINIKF